MTEVLALPEQERMATDIETYPDFVPTRYMGTIEPNNKCRGWNSKRDKYCSQIAGHNTDHKGEGRCAWHGKGGVTTHGRYAKHIGPSLKKHLIAIQEEDGDRTDLSQEVDMFRAIVSSFIEEYDQRVEALLAWNRSEYVEAVKQERRARPKKVPNIEIVADLLSKAAGLADKIHTQQHRDSIPKRDFFRLQDAQADAVRNRLQGVAHILGDDMVGDIMAGISDDWAEIRL